MRGWFAARGLVAALVLIVPLAGIFFLLPLDAKVIEVIAESNVMHPNWFEWAKPVSYYGDFPFFNLALFLGLQVTGWLLRSRRLLRVAVASILCASFAGMSANAIRCLTGRPRPSAGLEDRLHGPSFSSSLQSLPSAHTATAFGGAVSVLLAEPVIGVPLTIAAGVVAWSRLQLNRHHLTDVLVSVVIAFFFSLPLSRWAILGRVDARKRRSARVPASHVLTPTRLPH